MNDFSGLCLNRSFNFTGCKDSIGQSHTRHRHRTEDYIDSQVLNLMMTVIEGVSVTNTNKENIQGINRPRLVNLQKLLHQSLEEGWQNLIHIPRFGSILALRASNLLHCGCESLGIGSAGVRERGSQ